MQHAKVSHCIEILNEDSERIDTVYRKLSMVRAENRIPKSAANITHTAIILYKSKGCVAFLGKDGNWFAYYKEDQHKG